VTVLKCLVGVGGDGECRKMGRKYLVMRSFELYEMGFGCILLFY